MSIASHAVVFVSDPAFLLPTLVAARQVKQQVEADGAADIFILLVGFDAARRQAAIDIVGAEGFHVRCMDEIALPASVTFNRNHVPQSSLARFFITDHIPPHYANIVYLDGDIQVVGDIRPLLGLVVPDGFIAAANDKFWLGSFGRRKAQRSYLASLGISDPQHYFNSGVLAFSRKTWMTEGAEAFRFFLANSNLCRHHDQSALNVVFRNRRVVLPPAYNFITDYVLIGQDVAHARIIHFTGGLKPWYYFGTPWRNRFRDRYTSLAELYPALRSFVTVKSTDEQHAMQRSHRFRMMVRTLACPPMAAWRRARFRRYVQRTAFAVP